MKTSTSPTEAEGQTSKMKRQMWRQMQYWHTDIIPPEESVTSPSYCPCGVAKFDRHRPISSALQSDGIDLLRCNRLTARVLPRDARVRRFGTSEDEVNPDSAHRTSSSIVGTLKRGAIFLSLDVPADLPTSATPRVPCAMICRTKWLCTSRSVDLGYKCHHGIHRQLGE